MSILKNMEAVFIGTIILAGFTTFATADVRPAAPIATAGKMATVVVTAKRLTAGEKARLGS